MDTLRRLYVFLALVIVLTILAFVVTKQLALAEEPPPFLSPFDSVTVIHPAPGMDYLYDQHGNSATILQQGPGLSWYSQENKYGQIQSQGYLFDPLGPREPLTVPSVDRYAPGRDRHTR